MLGHQGCAGFSGFCAGPHSVVVLCGRGVRAALVRTTGSGARGPVVAGPAPEPRLGSRGTLAYLLHSVWELPRSAIEPMSPALADGFCTTKPPGNP